MRNTFLNTLVDLAQQDDRICLLVGDLGYSVVEPFRDRFGPRFINAGIAEQNMCGVAAGMAMAGHKVFTYSIANFPTLRCLEQIRNDICYHGADVTVVAVGGGIGYGSLGYSHHAVQDIACLRGFPGILMATPGDPRETVAVTRFIATHHGPTYLRLGKGGEPVIGEDVPVLEPGVRIIEAGNDLAVLAVGAALGWCAPVARAVGATLASLPLWWPDARSAASLRQLVEGHRRVVVVEEHLRAGGAGSFVCEQLDPWPELIPRVRCLALAPEACGAVGSPAFIRGVGGLDEAALRRTLAAP